MSMHILGLISVHTQGDVPVLNEPEWTRILKPGIFRICGRFEWKSGIISWHFHITFGLCPIKTCCFNSAKCEFDCVQLKILCPHSNAVSNNETKVSLKFNQNHHRSAKCLTLFLCWFLSEGKQARKRYTRQWWRRGRPPCPPTLLRGRPRRKIPGMKTGSPARRWLGLGWPCHKPLTPLLQLPLSFLPFL